MRALSRASRELQPVPPPISTAYFLTLTLLLGVLSLRLALRWAAGSGAQGRPEGRAVSIVGRFIGSAPVALVVMFMLEARGYNVVMVHVMGGALVLGRLVFAFSLDPERRESESYRLLRVLTWAGIAVGALYVVALVVRP